MDGENTTMMKNYIYARSLDSNNHQSRNWVKGLWGEISYKIPENWRICGENMYAKHSIEYNNLESYFLVYSIWDEKIVFEETETYGNVILLKDAYRYEYFDLIECIYDLKTKQIEKGIELNSYPIENDLQFKIGEVVLFEKSHRILAEAKIIEIVYEEYEIEIKRGRELNKRWIEKFKDVVINDDTLYSIKQWKPFYILDNGTKIKYLHELYHKYN